MRQMTEMSQWSKCLSKKTNQNVSAKKRTAWMYRNNEKVHL